MVHPPCELDELGHRPAEHRRVALRELCEVYVPMPIEIEGLEQLLPQEQVRPAHLVLDDLIEMSPLQPVLRDAGERREQALELGRREVRRVVLEQLIVEVLGVLLDLFVLLQEGGRYCLLHGLPGLNLLARLAPHGCSLTARPAYVCVFPSYSSPTAIQPSIGVATLDPSQWDNIGIESGPSRVAIPRRRAQLPAIPSVSGEGHLR
mmetsp:Transcript_12284/g.38942  ORF Transcript_12284/g.38942 Transcript_12284/m.38942 type:complete len:206 (-) Transcript_12284:48-665(-)